LTSESYVWIWLPGADEPVPAGVAVQQGEIVRFAYGDRYRRRDNAIAIFDTELPLNQSGFIDPLPGLQIAGCLNDAGPDSWGQKVILNRLSDRSTNFGELNRLTYLAVAGSDRIGALDFQPSSREYDDSRKKHQTSLDDLLAAATNVEEGKKAPPELDEALRAGSSIGGARPKALLTDGDRRLIAKFSSLTDTWPIVRAEYVAMRIAQQCGLNVAAVDLTHVRGRDVLLVERFDRVPGTTQRRSILSALTLLELPETSPQEATYGDLSELLRRRSDNPVDDRRELFARMTFNVLCGNTDDHARNHAAFWNGRELALTPAYDICPYPRSGEEATQAMRLGTGDDPYRYSNIGGCIQRAKLFGLTESEAAEIVEHQRATIDVNFDDICDQAELPPVDRDRIRRVFPNPFALYDLDD
jgi:serine/threonine-protein kinase HipA